MEDLFGPVTSASGQTGGRYTVVLCGDEEPVEPVLQRAVRFAGAPSRVLVSTTRACGADRRRSATVRFVEQPRDRGTTPGVLLPLLHVLDQDPWAWVAVLPRDPALASDARLDEALVTGVRELADEPEAVVLVGDAAVARGSSLARLVRRSAPDWWRALTNSFFRPAELDAVYARLGPSSFESALQDLRTRRTVESPRDRASHARAAPA